MRGREGERKEKEKEYEKRVSEGERKDAAN